MKKPASSLTLKKTTLRVLSSNHLTAVGGGGVSGDPWPESATCSWGCATQECSSTDPSGITTKGRYVMIDNMA